MCPVIGISPAFEDRRVEKVCHQTIQVKCHGELFFEHARSLKFRQTLQLIAGESLQKIRNKMFV